MKKVLSTILAVALVLSSMATVAFATEDNEYAEGYFYVSGNPDTAYTEINDAVSAAGAGGTVIVSGTVEFESRRSISTDITLKGVNDATIVPDSSFGSTDSTTNWKALLNLYGTITVEDVTFDGSIYGDTITYSTDFVPLRCVEGTITLNNVTVAGSPRSLMLVGSSSATATVNANGLYCDAPVKTINDGVTYADINVVNGTLNLNSGVVNGLICTDYAFLQYSGSLGSPLADGHFTLECYYTSVLVRRHADVTSTVKHFVATYENSVELADDYADDFLYTMTRSANQSVISDMVDWAEAYADEDVKTGFGNLLLDAADYATSGSSTETLLIGYAARLGVTEGE